MNHFPALCVAIAVLFGAMFNSLAAAQSTAVYSVGTSCSLDVVPACEPAQDFAVTTDGALTAEVTVSNSCGSPIIRFAVDGVPVAASDPVAIGGTTGKLELGPVTPGTHTLTVGADVPVLVNCDARLWAGTLAVTNSGVAASDVAFVAPGGTSTVSTVVAGSPRPAGVRATLFRSQAATTSALISVATYSGFPSGLPSPPPIRAAAFLDLQLTDAHVDDRIDGDFLPPSPIFPNDPLLPPNPIFPTDPLLPPNPIRLAWWSGAAWEPVFDAFIPGGPPIVPAYDSIANQFSVSFDIASAPSITALGGTVFAVIPNYYFRGFGVPVDAGTLNIAKAGRAVPLKWQLFDYLAAPVLDLKSAAVKVSSVQISCGASANSGDPLEEYAAGESGLQNLGNGVYQLNWSTSKSYAGTCRRLRLDVGERNPDGTVYYRTADFSFTR